jgi:hypothetical protein
MPKRKSAPLTVKVQKKKKKQQNYERREDSERYQQDLAHTSVSHQQRRSDPELACQELSRNNSTRQTRRSDPEVASNELLRDSSTRQTRRSDPEVASQELLRDNSTRRTRRSDEEYLQAESARDKSSQSRRRSKRVPWIKAEETYNTNVKDGPFHHCYSCDKLLFKTQTKVISRDELIEKKKCSDEYLKKLVLPNLVNEAVLTFCSTCMSYIKKLEFPRFNINQSNLKFPDVPDAVKSLTPLEERCVAARIPFMKITTLSHDKQLGIKSGVVNVPIDVRKTVNAIPQRPEDSGVIEISLMRKMEYKNAYLTELVRPAAIWNAARLLCNTPLYIKENIQLNTDLNPDDNGTVLNFLVLNY